MGLLRTEARQTLGPKGLRPIKHGLGWVSRVRACDARIFFERHNRRPSIRSNVSTGNYPSKNKPIGRK
jgi:hypothetical protein